jgi:DNA-binding Lrp family transcriptional regulator
MAVDAYVLFKVSSGTERESCEKIAEFEEVSMVSITYGEYDVIARVSAPDMQSLERFVGEKIRKVESLLVTSTMIIAREYKGKNYRTAK